MGELELYEHVTFLYTPQQVLFSKMAKVYN